MKKETKIYISIIGLLIIHFVFILFIQKSLYPIHLASQNIFVLDLVGKSYYLPNFLVILFELGNMVLLWLIGKKFFSGYLALIPVSVFTISPWGSYLAATGSFYIFLLFLLMVFVYSLLLIKEKSSLFGISLFAISSLLAVYSSVFFLFLIPIFIFSVFILKIVPSKYLKTPILLFVILVLPLAITIYKNRAPFKNIIQNQVRVFADPGLINTVDSYQGEARSVNMGFLARLSENKYLSSAENLLLKFSQQITPVTSFTPEEKLLNFSFSSPIYLGFLLPFFYGIYLLLMKKDARNFIFISALLTIPSVLAKGPVDLNRLVIFMPVIVFIISYGIIKLLEQKNKKLVYVLIFVVMVILQLLITVSDIKTREKDRYVKYFGQNYEVKEL